MDWKKFFIAFVAGVWFHLPDFGFLWYGKLNAWCNIRKCQHFGEPKPILAITSQRSFLGTL